MTDGLSFKILGAQTLLKNLRRLKEVIVSDLRKVFDANSLFMITYLRENKLVDKTTATTLSSRSMQLKRSLRAIPAKVTEKGVTAGITVGTPYAKVHFGDRGTSFTIRPRNKQFLTIPLPAALDSRGEARAGARDPRWGATFISKGIIFGYKGGYAKAAGKAREVVPLFVLKKEVTVPRRIFPSQIFVKLRPNIEKDIREVAASWRAA